jgi:hypothetical protein
MRLMPAERRDWAAAVWAEAPEAPPGLARLAWRAGGAWMLVREALLPRRIGRAMLFTAGAAAAVRVAWPGSSASFATPGVRGYVITMVLLLAGLPLLARPFLGPAHGGRAARFLRAGTCVALLALIPAEAAVYQFAETPPREGTDLRLYLLIAWKVGGKYPLKILFLVLMALYVAAIFWMTSRRSRIAPATLTVGTGAGLALGLVMYAVAPLGLSKAATNPWLPGSDIDPLVLLAWLLLLFGPVTAAVIADRRYTASGSAPLPPTGARFRQMMAAGLLTSLAGALFVTVLGMGTTAVMLRAAWLRDWLYHGPRLLYGVENLSSDLRTLPAIAYSHELTGSVDAGVLNAIIIIFPLIALVTTGFVAACRVDDAAAAPGEPRPGGGGPPGPGPAPVPPDNGQRIVTDDDASLAVGMPGLHEPGPGVEQDPLVAILADAVIQPAGTN